MSKKADGGAPAWIVTFADLMSLLLTFFVLLLSFSNMEVQEFKKVAGSMRSAFGLQSLDRLAGLIELEGFTSSTAVKHVVQIPIPEQDITDVVLPPEPEIVDEETEEPVQEVPDLQAEASRRTFNDLQELMASEIAADVMALIRSGNSTVIRFPDRQSFASGEGEMKPEFIPILSKVLKQLEKEKGQIIISGHTDNIPIHTEKYRSNWDLSASRATSVAQYIMDHTTITKDRITVQGYADSRPLAPNDSELNRAKNRRVEITVKLDESIVPAAP